MPELSSGLMVPDFLSPCHVGGGCVCYIYRGSISGHLSKWGWCKEKSYAGTELQGLWFQISSLRATWRRDMCDIFIYRGSIPGDLSQWGWRKEKII